MVAMSSLISPLVLLVALGDEWIESAAVSQSTRRAYRVEVNRFVNWAAIRIEGPPDRLEAKFVERFLSEIETEDPIVAVSVGLARPLQTSSLLQSKRILALWFSWAAERDRAQWAVVSSIRRWRPKPNRQVANPTPPSPPGPRKQSVESTRRSAFASALAYC